MKQDPVQKCITFWFTDPNQSFYDSISALRVSNSDQKHKEAKNNVKFIYLSLLKVGI